MRKGSFEHFISGLLGGAIGATIVLFATSQKPTVFSFAETVQAQTEQETVLVPRNKGKFESLEVENLVITNQATLLNKEGQPEIVLKDGSVMVENTIVGKKFVGRQFQGHALVANRIFCSPDDLIATPMENWRFSAEIGASAESGGEVIVRSAAGSSSVGKPTKEGALLRAGFDTDTKPQIIALQNEDSRQIPINYSLSEQQKRLLDNK
jgi:hypothetical protein